MSRYSVPPFSGRVVCELPVACTFDFNIAATKYFYGLEDGTVPICLQFSGTVFYEAEESGLQVAQIPWEKEASFRLPAATWRALMDLYYPNVAWLCLRKDLFARLDDFRSRRGIPTAEKALERLLGAVEEPVSS